ncbi:hypothetical protein PV04_03897 [Phialophora macrospora]|uniref:Uncharacterized protein n=1 Tax=Phialophora macrospora TaxID=1851006 RepID=A0A0D2FTK4_9EURO|nr:hypothetical protein PV04_03897 [Phialophora macrospora]
MALDVPDTGQRNAGYQTETDNIVKKLTDASSTITDILNYDDARLANHGRFRLNFFPNSLRALAEDVNTLWNVTANELQKVNTDLQNARKHYVDEHQARGTAAAELEQYKSNLKSLGETYAAEVRSHHENQNELQEVKEELYKLKQMQLELEQCKADLAALKEKQPALHQYRESLALWHGQNASFLTKNNPAYA